MRHAARPSWLLLVAGLVLVPGGRAGALGPAAATGTAPLVLTAAQLDTVTAGAPLTFQIELAAAATGADVLAATGAQSQIVRTEIVRAAFDPAAPEGARLRMIDREDAEVAMGSGHALAVGQSGATCTAQMTVIGDLAFSRSLSTAVTTPTTATCLCAVFAISLLK
ncbi:MAG TPA: hypothetical protein VKY65_14365 [Alphaproteobacteria bacterium]|nr:hypothetical protein [Alphaproteobacteria bacterium]